METADLQVCQAETEKDKMFEAADVEVDPAAPLQPSHATSGDLKS